MVKEKYPEIVKGNTRKFEVEHFDGSSSYKEDFRDATEYAFTTKGKVYTIIDGYGSSIDYFKGSHLCNRLGYAVLKLKKKKK